MEDTRDITGLEYRTVAGISVFRDPIERRLEDTNNDHDLHDTTRQPTERVYLLVKKPRQDHSWQFPQGGVKVKKNESVPQASLRELAEECGGQLHVKLIDQTKVICVYQYPFPSEFIKQKKKKKQYAGAKVCFVRAQWISGQCQPDGQEIVDYAWLTRDEIIQLVSREYAQGIQALLDSFL